MNPAVSLRKIARKFFSSRPGPSSSIADFWRQSPYYDRAEAADWLGVFWSDKSPFERMFRTLDRRLLLELACGHGRQSAAALERYPDIGLLRLLDVNQENVDFCRKRFAGNRKVTVNRNNGSDFRPFGKDSATAIFCYDAMVHFEYDAVIAYLKDLPRILVPGGRVLLHHSNYDQNPGGSWNQSPGGRNFMTRSLFAHIAMRCGLQVVEQLVMDWAAPQTDCLTLLAKPS